MSILGIEILEVIDNYLNGLLVSLFNRVNTGRAAVVSKGLNRVVLTYKCLTNEQTQPSTSLNICLFNYSAKVRTVSTLSLK
jgi:hypothetical protein